MKRRKTVRRKAIKKSAAILVKTDTSRPALIVTGPDTIALRAGTVFHGRRFAKQTPVLLSAGLEIGRDYGVIIREKSAPEALPLNGRLVNDRYYIGGFHYAPGGNARARTGGSTSPAINPYSLWDWNFRPTCLDPRGMTHVCADGVKPFWCDIYLTGANQLEDGTSRFGATIADGNDRPVDPATGNKHAKFDYATAVAVMKHQRKQLLSYDEFRAAAYGVTEKTANSGDPRTTQLDAPRTSKFGLMQATGNMWVWGHDGDPDMPRASMFGGSWFDGGYAGSRYADVAFNRPEDSSGYLGARGRSDHLQRV